MLRSLWALQAENAWNFHLRAVISPLRGSGKPAPWTARPSSAHIWLCTSQLWQKCDAKGSQGIGDTVCWSGLETLWLLQQLHPLFQEKLYVHVPLDSGVRAIQRPEATRNLFLIWSQPPGVLPVQPGIGYYLLQVDVRSWRAVWCEGWGIQPAFPQLINKLKGMWNPSSFLQRFYTKWVWKVPGEDVPPPAWKAWHVNVKKVPLQTHCVDLVPSAFTATGDFFSETLSFLLSFNHVRIFFSLLSWGSFFCILIHVYLDLHAPSLQVFKVEQPGLVE